MSKRPKGDPPSGERPPQPPREAITAPVEKKDSASFVAKIAALSRLAPEERVPKIEALYEEYKDVLISIEDARLYSMLFAHPEQCRAAIVWDQWILDHRIEASHEPKHTQSLLENWDRFVGVAEQARRMLDQAINGKMPTKEDLSAEVRNHLYQGTTQTMSYFYDTLASAGFDMVARLQWFGSLSDQELEKVIYEYHDMQERIKGLDIMERINAAEEWAAQQFRKWREGQGKRK